MPALPVQNQPHALMAIDLNSSRDLSPAPVSRRNSGNIVEDKERRARMRVKSHQRLRSYQQIVEDFHEQARAASQQEEGDEEDDKFGGEDDEDSDVFFSPAQSTTASPHASPRKQRKEDTARRLKRFSLPAIALHATNVTARTTEIGSDTSAALEDRTSGSGGMPSPAKSNKRFSLVLAGRNSHYSDGNGAGDGSRPHSAVISKHASEEAGDAGLGTGVAAAKLAELLRKAKAT